MSHFHWQMDTLYKFLERIALYSTWKDCRVRIILLPLPGCEVLSILTLLGVRTHLHISKMKIISPPTRGYCEIR